MGGDVIAGLRSLVVSRFKLYNGLLKITLCILLLKNNMVLCNYDHKTVKPVTPLNKL